MVQNNLDYSDKNPNFEGAEKQWINPAFAHCWPEEKKNGLPDYCLTNKLIPLPHLIPPSLALSIYPIQRPSRNVFLRNDV
jgi:hypothetical protein